MRLFVSVEIPKKIKDNLFELKREIPGNIAKINWVSKKNLHITLKFLGNIDEKKIDELVEKLNKISFNEFKLEFDELGFFSFKGNPKIIRLSFKEDAYLINLQKKIDEELLDMFSLDQKFSPHMTMGRIKLIKKKKELFDKLKNLNFSKDEIIVNSFDLVESKLSKDGPKYKILKKFKA